MSATVALILGTRPEAIKLAPVYNALKKLDGIEPKLWLTGQHREMVFQAIATFSLREDYDLELMVEKQSLVDLTAKALCRLSSVFERERPDMVVVQGDTTTAFTAAFAAFLSKIPVAHVEAGLRTGSRYLPFPEEMNRKLVGSIADYHFAPTEGAKENLLREGISPENVWVTGNTVIDALRSKLQELKGAVPDLPNNFPLEEIRTHPFVLITGHRRESFGEGLRNICRAIASLAHEYSGVRFVYPVHMNPHVRQPTMSILSGIPNVYLTEPLNYPAFVWAMEKCHLILSDSGGVQEEASYLGKPLLIMRDTTERPEAIAGGSARLVGTSVERIVGETALLLRGGAEYAQMSKPNLAFGDGFAAETIATILALKVRERNVQLEREIPVAI